MKKNMTTAEKAWKAVDLGTYGFVGAMGAGALLGKVNDTAMNWGTAGFLAFFLIGVVLVLLAGDALGEEE